MLPAVLGLAALGGVLGLALALAARAFAVDTDAKVADLEALLPGTNCGQCGFPGCAAGAAALAEGRAGPTLCPPGGRPVAAALAGRLGVEVDLAGVVAAGPQTARVIEDVCIGCTRCIRDCPTDAILGAPKQMHTVLAEACSGCGACIECCPTDALVLQTRPPALHEWGWPKPLAA